MTKAIRSYPKEEQSRVISNRVANKTGRLGYWAAVDAQKYHGTIKKGAKSDKTGTDRTDSQ